MEYILCAANHYLDKQQYEHQPFNVESGFVVCGWRHHNIITLVGQLLDKGTMDPREETEGKGYVNWDKELPGIQGFLTNTNRFVDRKEAAKIAYEAGQIEREKKYLFSEDVY